MKPNLKELIASFNLEPKEAIEFFKRLGIKPSGSWQDTLEAVLADAFAIAGVKNMDMLLDAQEIIELAMKEGKDLREFKNYFKEELKLRNWHASLVVTQNISNAYSAGRLDRQSKAVTLPLLRFVLGGREHHTEGCLYLANNKIAVRQDDPDLRKIYTPRHFRCGTIAFAVSEKWCEKNGYTIKKIGDIPPKFLNTKGFEHLPNIPFRNRIDLEKYPDELLNKFEEYVNVP
jgi:uncharacterized protein with gpF-like domain